MKLFDLANGIVLFAVSFIVFFISYEAGHYATQNRSCSVSSRTYTVQQTAPVSIPCPHYYSNHNNTGSTSCLVTVQKRLPNISPLLTKGFVEYKEMRLINIKYPEWSLLLHQRLASDCHLIVHAQTSLRRKFSCMALVQGSIDGAYNLLRHEEVIQRVDDDEAEGGKVFANATGFFGGVPNDNGRRLLRRKLSPILDHFQSLSSHFLSKLWRHNLLPGRDALVVLVVNAGEMDVLANLRCSLTRANLTANNLIVFAASESLVPLIEGMGLIAFYHRESFPAAPMHAAFEYLDPIFVDMMFYKALALWLPLQLGFDVLFQDADLVWFRDPLPFLMNDLTNDHLKRFGSRPDGFFSDDGQRSLRYAPFYANSGFFFLYHSPVSVQFAWSVLSAFAVLHISGSHQNVFTLRLLELLDMSGLKPAFLSMRLFPSGVKFSHDRPFMRAIKDGHERPFIFHMCWTKNKEHKLDNFKLSDLWFVSEQASNALGVLGNETEHGRPVKESDRGYAEREQAEVKRAMSLWDWQHDNNTKKNIRRMRRSGSSDSSRIIGWGELLPNMCHFPS